MLALYKKKAKERTKKVSFAIRFRRARNIREEKKKICFVFIIVQKNHILFSFAAVCVYLPAVCKRTHTYVY